MEKIDKEKINKGYLLRNISAEFFKTNAKIGTRQTYTLFLDFIKLQALILPPQENGNSLDAFQKYINNTVARVLLKTVMFKKRKSILIFDCKAENDLEENQEILLKILHALQSDPIQNYAFIRCIPNFD